MKRGATGRPDGDEASDAGRISTAGTLTYVLIGPIIRAVHFGVLYAAHAFSCDLAQDGQAAMTQNSILAVIWIATLVAIALLTGALVAPHRLSSLLGTGGRSAVQTRFHRQAMSWLAVLALLAIGFAAASTMFVDPCLITS